MYDHLPCTECTHRVVINKDLHIFSVKFTLEDFLS